MNLLPQRAQEASEPPKASGLTADPIELSYGDSALNYVATT
jgi:hypothetical protein